MVLNTPTTARSGTYKCYRRNISISPDMQNRDPAYAVNSHNESVSPIA